MGAAKDARELIRASVGEAFSVYLGSADLRPVVTYFEAGGNLKLRDDASSGDMVAQLRKVPGLFEALSHLGIGGGEPAPVTASAAEFVLEGLYGQKKIGRGDDRGFVGPQRHSDPAIDLEQLRRRRPVKEQ